MCLYLFARKHNYSIWEREFYAGCRGELAVAREFIGFGFVMRCLFLKILGQGSISQSGPSLQGFPGARWMEHQSHLFAFQEEILSSAAALASALILIVAPLRAGDTVTWPVSDPEA